MAEDIPAGAQRSPDGLYWWDEPNQAWQLVSAAGSSSAATPAAEASQAGTERTGTITFAPAAAHQLALPHDDVVAMVQQGGAELPPHEDSAVHSDSGEAYA